MSGKKRALRVSDLFCGVGGLSLGFESAGFNLVSAYDSWGAAVANYGQNFSHPVKQCDISCRPDILERLRLDKPDVIIGGPPCQDFSHAGKRMERNRASLTTVFAEIVEATRPEFFVMENVPRVAASRTWGRARPILKRAGYGLTEIVIDASRCKVPQIRKRFLCIGALEREDDHFLDALVSTQSRKSMTVAQHMEKDLDTEFYYRHPRNYTRRAVYTIHEPSATIRGVNRPIPRNYPGHPLDAAPVRDSRPLTTMERARIQTFPKRWRWLGTKTNVEQMIGNAVPPNLGKFVARALLAVA
ncbi:MAG: DNA (cytosine-5-)-methyltransferase [Alphaproteobacteria bacterium]|nr:DNA (cytosine-5-)-methyltransferase [Alphaproteobacteria bacterium]MDA8003598.1 DNA (cytosine-5-)-methyltransferase [Alphaproteobacteria bacterium]MDA8005285.1 DNA (cytosine-5-)-methyltransferase [Alphaproteobacteria bacterium]MDA8012841.1 DNA (cytosine-5-)-methyltransferase [Alphaproteobacteria bacterium]